MVVNGEPYARPRPATHSEQAEMNRARHERQLDELRTLAKKRFWELFWDETFRWWGVRDSLGNIVFHPRPESEIRGFFAGLPPQA